ncbi:hypothetical protein [Methylobacterium brachiatum]|uniref:hypothetical protein n=1 Tax=Methylobacterium brachiatum TaxID=269660 RepID=UPI000EFAD674|nr:hypothetical protein [Methylobacterium brachiatum]AYO83642.1 hypothetical protein EBB05_16135 [Methylobacterium brachiatum]
MSLRILGFGCLGVICSAILTTAGVLAWFAADRALPTEVLSSEVLTPRVRPGDKLVIRQRVRYMRNCAAHVDRALYDAHTHREFLRDVDYDQPPLGLGTKTITFEEDVPANFKGGVGEYRALPSYSCNPLQKYYWPITRPETLLRFEIVGDEMQASP